MRLSNRQIVAAAIALPQHFPAAKIAIDFRFVDMGEIAVLEAMQLVEPNADYDQWVGEVMDMAKALESRVDWPAWWRETMAVEESLLADIKQHRKTLDTSDMVRK